MAQPQISSRSSLAYLETELTSRYSVLFDTLILREAVSISWRLVYRFWAIDALQSIIQKEIVWHSAIQKSLFFLVTEHM